MPAWPRPASQPAFSGSVDPPRIPLVAESGEYGPIICDVKPMVVVEDTAKPSRSGCRRALPQSSRGRSCRVSPRPWLEGEYKLVDSVWDRWNQLMLMVPGQWRAPGLVDARLGVPRLVRKPRRALPSHTPRLRCARPLADVVADAERRWRWKDEDELERVIEHGLLSEAVAAPRPRRGRSRHRRHRARRLALHRRHAQTGVPTPPGPPPPSRTRPGQTSSPSTTRPTGPTPTGSSRRPVSRAWRLVGHGIESIPSRWGP